MAAGSLETWACQIIVAADMEAYILIASEGTPRMKEINLNIYTDYLTTRPNALWL